MREVLLSSSVLFDASPSTNRSLSVEAGTTVLLICKDLGLTIPMSFIRQRMLSFVLGRNQMLQLKALALPVMDMHNYLLLKVRVSFGRELMEKLVVRKL